MRRPGDGAFTSSKSFTRYALTGLAGRTEQRYQVLTLPLQPSPRSCRCHNLNVHIEKRPPEHPDNYSAANSSARPLWQSFPTTKHHLLSLGTPMGWDHVCLGQCSNHRALHFSRATSDYFRRYPNMAAGEWHCPSTHLQEPNHILRSCLYKLHGRCDDYAHLLSPHLVSSDQRR